MDQTKTSGGATRRKAAKPAAGKRAKRPLEGPLDPVRESMDQGISVVEPGSVRIGAHQGRASPDAAFGRNLGVSGPLGDARTPI